MKRRLPAPAFTLVELLVVLGIVSLMAGGLGLALRDGDSARGLESAQSTLASLVAAARSQAVLSQNRTQLVVDADPEGERFLRGVHVAVESAPNSGQWWLTDHGAVFPRGVYVVPGVATVTGSTYSVGGGAGAWPVTRHSSIAELPAAGIAPDAGNPAGKFLGMIAPLTAAGLSGSGGDDKFVLAPARRTIDGIIFEHPDQVRGIALSSYAMAIPIDDAADFDF